MTTPPLIRMLSPQELTILLCLLQAGGQVVSAGCIGMALWGTDYDELRAVHQAMHRLRRKLGPALGAAIVSVRNEGYRWDVAAGARLGVALVCPLCEQQLRGK